MLKGDKVVLRPMRREDIVRQHEFDQDIELYGLDSDYPRVSPLESTQAFYASRAKIGPDTAPFAIEADGKYIALTTSAKNVRALCCFLACGFVEGGRPRQVVWIEGEYVDLLNMAILREEWQSR